ncbi:DUF559 domain-containing protein [Vandammella animalimorsus]|uniref:DUF559 domain-containing protein n=2 Tax=Vandammella animalimorsus TaxID=2029117 RepID=A0A3M6RUT3_9BURK|nr:DUF559 domain-containing protein [Vandammella animalimorsus]
MGEISAVVGGGTPSTANEKNFGGDVPWITPADMSTHTGKYISAGGRYLSHQGMGVSGAQWLPKNTVLFSSRAPIGYCAIASQSVTTNQGFKSFIPMEGIDSEYLYYWLISAKRHAEALASGTTFLELSAKKAAQIPVPIAPAAEQTRIVEKLEELLADLDAGVAELKAAQKKLAQYRQSLLKAAVQGDLTADWRRAQAAARTAPPLSNPSPLAGERRASTPLSPCGRGDGGEGALALTRARELRQKQTPHEQTLWRRLRAKRFDGFKFRRQQPIGHFIVDFVCFSQRLIIELDGGGHAERQDYDARRDAWLRSQGFRVLRFWNNQLAEQPEAVLEAIWNALHDLPAPLSPTPLPQGERGLMAAQPSLSLCRRSAGEEMKEHLASQLPSPFGEEGLLANPPSPLVGEGSGERGQIETGAELLSRILKERRARWEAKQLEKFAQQGKTPPKNWQSKYPEPALPDTQNLPALPEGWTWSTLGVCFQVVVGATPSRKNSTYWGGNIPWVSSGEVHFNHIRGTKESISELGLNNSSTQINPAGSVLLGMIGEGKTRGQVAILDIPAANNQNCAAIWVSETPIKPEFVYYWLWSRYDETRRGSSGNNQPALNKSIVERIVIPIPSLQEVDKIVMLVATALQQISLQEEAITLALKQSTAQRQNILRAAFAGELVPQDPNDEPASVLLARIRAQRAAQTPAKKPRGRKKKEAL